MQTGIKAQLELLESGTVTLADEVVDASYDEAQWRHQVGTDGDDELLLQDGVTTSTTDRNVMLEQWQSISRSGQGAGSRRLLQGR